MQAKEGRWIFSQNMRGAEGYYCSKCDFFIVWPYGYYDKPCDCIKQYNYCPHCGRKMIVPCYDNQKKSQ